MAIKSRSVSSGNREMTTEEFKWWMKKFDSDKDGRISREELAEAVRFAGGWFAGKKSRRGMRAADADGNGFIEGGEIERLVEFAQKHLGVKVVDLY